MASHPTDATLTGELIPWDGDFTRVASPQQETADTRASPKRHSPWMGPSSSNWGQGTLEDIINEARLKTEIENIVNKVEKAVGDLSNSAGNKKIRRSFSMAAEEVREFTKRMAEKEAIEGIQILDQKAVVVLSSDSSEEGLAKGKKKKSTSMENFERAVGVSSRVCSKLKIRAQEELLREIHMFKRPRFPVKKVKLAITPSTKLTLAPPSQGQGGE